MIGILTEKPSAARNFAKALGGMKGTYNGESYMITNAFGHLFEFEDPARQVPADLREQYSKWNIEYLPWDETQFNWKRKAKPDVSQQLVNINRVMNQCDEWCIATDKDASGEGELLAWEILDYLKPVGKKFTRMFFVDESVKEIQKAFLNRQPIASMDTDMDYVKANYRSQWDLLSMQFTRIATHCAGGAQVIRQGRLKSCMVKMVGDGLKAYNEYVKVTRYTNKFKDENGVIYSSSEEPIYDKKEDVPQTYHASEVVCDKKEMKHTAPPKLVDLAALSAALAPKGYSAKSVQSTYQKMYENQVVSYPRTDDKVISPEQFNDLLPKIDAIADVVGVDKSLLTHRTARKTHVKTGGAHGANRPGPNVPSSMADITRQYGELGADIYELLAKNYLAMLAEDYEYELQKGHVKDYPKFTGSASVPKALGWKQVYKDVSLDDDADDSSLGLGTMADPFIADVVNPRPPKPTMKWLMKLLEKYDVGTGATRNSTYAEVTNASTKYPLLVDKRGAISFADCGAVSYVLIQGTQIADPVVTEQLFHEMDEIAAGKKNPEACLHKMQDMVKSDMAVMLANQKNLSGVIDPDVLSKFQRAGVKVKEKYTGTWDGKAVTFSREWGNHRFTDEECEQLCNGEEIVLELMSQKGKPYYVHGKLDNMTYNGYKYVGFNNLGFCDENGQEQEKADPFDRAVKWFEEHFQYVFSEDEKVDLKAKKKIHVDGLVGKKGVPYGATLRYGKQSNGYMGILQEFDSQKSGGRRGRK